MKRKMKPAAKVVLGLLFVAIVLGGAYFMGFFEKETAKVDPFQNTTGTPAAPASGTSPIVVTDVSDNVLNLSLDQWIGWKPIFDANGGELKTQPGSEFDKLGIKVNINIIDDPTQSSTALISGNLNAAGYTVNRYAFLHSKFKENNTPVKMVYITNFSSGGDGIICLQNINRFEDLVGKHIGVPRFSEAQTLVEFMIAKANLTDAQRKQIRNDIVWFNDPGECGKALFSGQVAAAATWQPFISQAQTTAGFKVLFSTKDATNLILDGIVMRDDFAKSHPELVQKFIEGCLNGAKYYTTDLKSVRKMPAFADMTDGDITGMLADATLSDFSMNSRQLSGTAQNLFAQMSQLWINAGEKAFPADSDAAFDKTYLSALTGKFELNTTVAPVFTPAQVQKAVATDNNNALLTQRLTINFETNSAAISPDSLNSIVEFAKTAELLNNVVIQIEGNTDSVGSAAANKKLSLSRAESVKKYLTSFGIDGSRIAVIGNGPDKPIANNTTPEGKAANRRTDVYFKTVQ